jgi:hypothetical protein
VAPGQQPGERLHGLDKQPGWQTTTKSKAFLLDKGAESFREGETIIHNFETYVQLGSIEGASLRAPEDQHDDRAIAYVLALYATMNHGPFSPPFVVLPGPQIPNPYPP